MGNDDTEEIPKPHSLLFHPYLTWKDKLTSTVVDYLMLKALVATQPGTQECADAVVKARTAMEGFSSDRALRSTLEKWGKLSSCKIAESWGSISFQKDILKDWGIVDEQTVLPDAASKNRESAGVVVRFPSSLLAAKTLESPTILEKSGCIEVDFDTIDWKTFAPDVPVIVQFHGGGMTMGTAGDLVLHEETVRLVETASTASPPDVITISVDYALAPEDPFPLGIMDALSVMDFLLNKNVRKSVHVTGQSAGANIALVAGMEVCRRFPGRISSIHVQSPYVNPACDGLSYHMNQSVTPDIGWCRWFSRVYLELEKPPSDETPKDENKSDLEKVLQKDSNYSLWENWKARYPSKSLHRLVNPTLQIPAGLNGDKSKSAPAIIIRYNRSDPLHSDGEMVVEALKPNTGGNASFFECNGLHCDITTPYDPSAPQDYYKVWAEALFDNGSSEN